MLHTISRILLAVALLIVPGRLAAQNLQVFGGVGFGSYHPVSFTSPAGSAFAAPGQRFVLNALVERQLSDHFAIEAGWTYQDGDYQLVSGATKTAFDAGAQVLRADVIGYLRPRSKRLRPYVVGGTGIKLYQGSETPSPRPLAQFGSFRDGTDPRALLSFGGGLEYSLNRHWGLRVDLRDDLTPFPTAAIVPAAGVTAGAWLHDFVPTVGVTFR